MWKSKYRIHKDSLIRDIRCPKSDSSVYQITFDFDKERYYCYVDASSVEEALGIFFMCHENITYNHIVDHFEY